MNWNCPLPKYGRLPELTAWLQQQVDWCDDAEFGVRFAGGCPVPGASPVEYQHRQLSIDGQSLLMGIRFKGRDMNRPFVDLLAWTGDLQPSWLPVIAREFVRFGPRAVRYCLSPDVPPLSPATIDQHLVAGPAAGDEQPMIVPAHDLSWYDEYRRGYDEWSATTPLGREVRPEDRDSLEECLSKGRIVVSLRDGALIGIAACRPQAVRAISGWTIVEEFVVSAAQGAGLGTKLQRSLMHLLPEGECVWGTIHGRNVASLATARRCGREIVETWWMTPL